MRDAASIKQCDPTPYEPEALRAEPPFARWMAQDIVPAATVTTMGPWEDLASWAASGEAAPLQTSLSPPASPELSDLRDTFGRDSEGERLDPAQAHPQYGPFGEPVVIAVGPRGDGWSVSSSAASTPLGFRSRRSAERAARRMALQYAEAGRWSELRLTGERGGAARFVCAPTVLLSPLRS